MFPPKKAGSKSQSIFFQRLEKPRGDRAKSRIDNLKEALKCFDDDIFVICKSCKNAIPDTDLLALPERMFCKSCLEYGSNDFRDKI